MLWVLECFWLQKQKASIINESTKRKSITTLKNKPRSLAGSRHNMSGLRCCHSLILIALLSHILTYSQAERKHLHKDKSCIQTPKYSSCFYFCDSFLKVGIFFFFSQKSVRTLLFTSNFKDDLSPSLKPISTKKSGLDWLFQIE